MTAYIKMVDIWMIFTMMYPFSVVMFYSLLEFLMKFGNIHGSLVSDRRDRIINITTRIALFMLDIGLPILATIFILAFWALGITNFTSSGLDNYC